MKEYRGVNERCAFDFSGDLPLSKDESIKVLEKRGFEVITVNMLEIARQQLGKRYKRGVKEVDLPNFFDCSSLTRYLYAQLGIWLPKKSIQQRGYANPIELSQARFGDLIFKKGAKNYFTDSVGEIGHVGFATGEGTIIHASGIDRGVIETSIESFCVPKKFRGARRVVSDLSTITTLSIPQGRLVESSSDIYWLLFQLSHAKVGA